MNRNYDFSLTPAYCLYNGAAVFEQDGAYIKFLVENKNDSLLCGRLTRAFQNHVANIRKIKDCPEIYRRLITIDFEKATRAQIKKCVLSFYRAEEENGGVSAETENSRNEREAAAVLLLDSILNEARLRKATDIHIANSSVKLRINGRLEKMMELQSEKSTELIQRIKLLAGLNVIEKRKCQDGTFVYGNKAPFFLRVSTMTAIGEKMNGARSAVESVVLRILDTSRIPLALGELGFNSMQLEKIGGSNGLCSLSNGLVLVCGPTGAGKSTTAAAMLVEMCKLTNGSIKIVSLEDPPEYIIPGVTQIKIDDNNGFSEALKHVFRQDPDVIMIGEIRDEQSAAAALRASLTGHLVLATLHCGCASESIFRLENLGLDRRLLCQVLRAVICQELNLLGGKMRLYADVTVCGASFSEKAVKAQSGDQLEKLLEHYTNYSEILSETMSAMKHAKPVPLYKRRRENAGIHKDVV